MPKDDVPTKNIETSHLNILPIRELQLPTLSIDDHASEIKESKEGSSDAPMQTEVTFPKVNAVLPSNNGQDGQVEIENKSFLLSLFYNFSKFQQ